MHVNVNIFNILIAFGALQGLTFGILLIFLHRGRAYAHYFLGTALLIVSLFLSWTLVIDWGLATRYTGILYFPFWFTLALGPALYFYVRSMTEPAFKLQRSALWHFSPVILEQAFHLLAVVESRQESLPYLSTSTYNEFGPLIQLFGILSILFYSFRAQVLLQRHQKRAGNFFSDQQKHSLTWLRQFLLGYAVLWFMWVPYTFIDYVYFGFQLSIAAYYPIYLFLTILTLSIALESYRRPVITLAPEWVSPMSSTKNQNAEPDPEMKHEALGLKKKVVASQLFLDPDLSIHSLANHLGYPPPKLSRIINQGLQCNFSDFVNEMRVREMQRRLLEEAYAHYSTEAIGYDVGFNSRATYNRAFKKFTGISPGQFRRSRSKNEK